MRVIECVCGEVLRSETDDGLLVRAREHVKRYHPELRLGDERLRNFVANVAYYGETTGEEAHFSRAEEERVEPDAAFAQ